MTGSNLQDLYHVEEAEDAEKKHISVEKEAQKLSDTVARNAHLQAEAANRIFEHPLSHYKRRDVLELWARIDLRLTLSEWKHSTEYDIVTT